MANFVIIISHCWEKGKRDGPAPRQETRQKIRKIFPRIVKIHKNVGVDFIKNAQAQIQFDRKTVQFAQIDTANGKTVLNSKAQAGTARPKSE